MREGNFEFALGETRRLNGEVLGTFVCVAQLEGDGRLHRYLLERTPAVRFDSAGPEG